MSLKKIDHEIVYSTTGVVFKIIKKGESIVFLDKAGDEIDLQDISEHTKQILIQAAQEFPWPEDDDNNDDVYVPGVISNVIITPQSGPVMLSEENFIFTVDFEGEGIRLMDVKMDIQSKSGAWNSSEFFSLKAEESAPWGQNESEFTSRGIAVSYTETSSGGIFELDFGATLTIDAIASGEITISIEIGDEYDTVWGDINNPDETNSVVIDIQELG